MIFWRGWWTQHTAHVDAFPASTWLLTVICIFMCTSLFHSLIPSLRQNQKSLTPRLQHVFAWHWQVRSCSAGLRPLVTPLELRHGTLWSVKGPPRRESSTVGVWADRGLGVGRGFCQDERRYCISPAVCFASPTPRIWKSQYLLHCVSG